MILNEIALKRQPTVLLLLVLIVLVGAYSYITLPRESFPDMEIPYIFITTPYEGVAPADIESLITIPLERKLKALSDVEEIRSSSAEGISTVAVEFSTGVDIDDALQKVRDKVDLAKNDLPKDLARDPIIKEFNFTEWPVMRVTLAGPYSLKRLKSLADEYKDRFEAMSGVLEARLSGGLTREIHVEFDLDRVRAFNVPFSALVQAVQNANVNMPGGAMDIGNLKYTVRIPEDYKHPAEIFNIIIYSRNGKPVYLREVATITDSNKDQLTMARINGQPSVSLAVMKRTGENIIEVSDGVRQIVAELEETMPPDLKVYVTSDMADEIRMMLADLENNILTGLLLVLVVILLFIGGRSAIFVALAIPYSMLITFALLMGLDVTLNMVVLFSLILALGMLVDNGIVIVENIYRHMQQGEDRATAARIGANQVAWPVITSTLTTLGAFFPILFFPGIMGEFMKYLPLTLIMALSASLFVALVINPVLSARYQSVGRTKGKEIRQVEDSRVIRLYGWLLKGALKIRLAVVFLAFAALVLSIMAVARFGAGTEFFPEVEPNRANIYIKAPEGTNLAASDALVREVEGLVQGYDDVRYIIANVGSEGGNIFAGGGTGTHINRVVLDFKDFGNRSRPSSEIVREIREKLARKVHGAEIQVAGEENGPPTGAAINLEIYGEDIERLGRLAQEIRTMIKPISGLVDLKDDFVKGKPEIRVDIDKEKAALLGLDTFTIAYTVKAAIAGAKVGVFRQGKDEYDIIARLPEKDRNSVESLKRLTISNMATGQPIPLTTVADVFLTSGLGSINRLDQKRVVTITGDAQGRLANDIIVEIGEKLENFSWPAGYSYKFTGEQQEQRESQDFLGKAFIASIFIIFLILVTQFNSIVTPLIVLTSVALSLIGVFLGLIITGKPFGVIMTGVGVISLAGVVVNNAIVLIDYYNQLVERGLTVREALVRAGMVRFRPVLLTAVTTILGLVPMAVGISFNFRELSWELASESSQMWSSMATAVIFGLTVATLLTLFVVPVLCSLAASASGREKKILLAVEARRGDEGGPRRSRTRRARPVSRPPSVPAR